MSDLEVMRGDDFAFTFLLASVRSSRLRRSRFQRGNESTSSTPHRLVILTPRFSVLPFSKNARPCRREAIGRFPVVSPLGSEPECRGLSFLKPFHGFDTLIGFGEHRLGRFDVLRVRRSGRR